MMERIVISVCNGEDDSQSLSKRKVVSLQSEEESQLYVLPEQEIRLF